MFTDVKTPFLGTPLVSLRFDCGSLLQATPSGMRAPRTARSKLRPKSVPDRLAGPFSKACSAACASQRGRAGHNAQEKIRVRRSPPPEPSRGGHRRVPLGRGPLMISSRVLIQPDLANCSYR